jgi:hypothetical protein
MGTPPTSNILSLIRMAPPTRPPEMIMRDDHCRRFACGDNGWPAYFSADILFRRAVRHEINVIRRPAYSLPSG